MRSEIKLDGNYYKLIGLPTQTQANQMASKVGQGTSEYGDLTTWSAWIQDDWQDGIGNLRPHEGNGILYAEAESRVPNQLILRGKLQQVDTRQTANVPADCRYNPTNVVGSFACSSATTTTKAAIEFTTPATLNSTTFWAYVWLQAAAGTQILFEVRNNNAGSPGASVIASTTVTHGTTFPGFCWVGGQLAYSGTLVAGTTYWLCVSTTSGSFSVGYGITGYSVNSKLLVSGSWVDQTTKYMAYLTTAQQMVNMVGNNNGSGFFRFTSTADTLYCYGGNRLYKYSVANDNWVLVASGSGVVSGLISSVGQLSGTVYFADDAPLISSSSTMSTSETISNSTGVDATGWRDAGGYLWKAHTGIDVSYTTDGSTYTHTTDMRIGSWDRYITGMCNLGDDMCISTTEGLYRITAGDFARPIMRWGSIRANNGMSMVNHEGSLYAVADNRVYRFTQDLQRQDIWLTRDDDLITARLGKVQSVCTCNSWLIAFCGDNGGNSKPTAWAFQNEHWHCIATFPDSAVQGTDNGLINYACYYDATTSYLWFMTPQGVTYRLYMPGTAINPYNDTSTAYAAEGWVEWDWFDSPVRDAPKDYDSIAIIGENISATCPINLYWKDDASTDWELLGTVSSNYQEFRWTLASGNRPNTRRFKLGLRLATSAGASTPRIRAIRVKYHLMVRDWFRWNLTIDVAGTTEVKQETDDGTRNTLTATQIKDAVSALCTQVAPFVFQDVDGKQYEVKITDASFSYKNYEYREQTTFEKWEGVWNLVIEMVTQGTLV